MKTIKLTLTHLMCCCFGLFSMNLMAQVGIGTNTPHASAALDVVSTNKGVLVPRVVLNNPSTADPVTSPATGLLVYNDGGTATEGFYYWNSSSWVLLTTGSGSGDNLGNHTATQSVNLSTRMITNNGTTAGITLNNAGKATLGNELTVTSIPAGNATSDEVLTVDASGNVRKVPASSFSGGSPFMGVNGNNMTLSNDVTNFYYSPNTTVTLPDPAQNSGDVIVGIILGGFGNITFGGSVNQLPIHLGTRMSSFANTYMVYLISDGSDWYMARI